MIILVPSDHPNAQQQEEDSEADSRSVRRPTTHAELGIPELATLLLALLAMTAVPLRVPRGWCVAEGLCR